MRNALLRALALAVLGCTIVLSNHHPALAADPTHFAIVTSSAQAPPEVSLNGEVKVRLDGDTVIDPKKVQLWLDGSPLGAEPRLFSDRRELAFPLTRTTDNRDLWSRLLGSPLSNQKKPVIVGIQYDRKPLELTNSPKADETKEAKITLVTYNTFLIILGFAAAAAAILLIATAAWKTTLIRDSVIPQLRDFDRSFSLGRLQMLVWTCLILSSFLFILTVTWDFNSLNAESFILMGISASTALAAIAIDRSKEDAIAQTKASVEQLGIVTLADVKALYAGDQAKKARPTIAAAAVPGAAGGAANNDPTFQELMAAYTPLVAGLKSKGFLDDLVNDANGPTIHRWQILIWTAVLAAIYIGKVYANLEMPTFGTNLLALMGISGGAYLGFKIPEKQ